MYATPRPREWPEPCAPGYYVAGRTGTRVTRGVRAASVRLTRFPGARTLPPQMDLLEANRKTAGLIFTLSGVMMCICSIMQGLEEAVELVAPRSLLATGHRAPWGEYSESSEEHFGTLPRRPNL